MPTRSATRWFPNGTLSNLGYPVLMVSSVPRVAEALTCCGLLTRNEVLDQLRTGTGGLFHVDDLADAGCIKLEFVDTWFDR